ncbi:MAG: hypothetical protein JSS50_05285 [Proteobacteria bacterium]|nr:hypothetical protein [Pseudomonadota bacterium]
MSKQQFKAPITPSYQTGAEWYDSAVGYLQRQLGYAKNPHAIKTNTTKDCYADADSKKTLVLELMTAQTSDNFYATAWKGERKHTGYALQMAKYLGLAFVNTPNESQSHLVVVNKESAGNQYGNNSDLLATGAVDKKLSEKYAHLLAQLHQHIEATFTKMVNEAMTAVEELEGSDDYKKRHKKQRQFLPRLTLGLYGVTAAVMIAGAGLAHAADVARQQMDALIAQVCKQELDNAVYRYYEVGGAIGGQDYLKAIIAQDRGFDLYTHWSLNPAERVAILQIRSLYEPYPGEIASACVLLVLGTAAIFSLWTILYADRTQDFVYDERAKAFNEKLSAHKSQFCFAEQGYTDLDLSKYMSGTAVDMVKVQDAMKLENTEFTIKEKVRLMHAVLEHDRGNPQSGNLLV